MRNERVDYSLYLCTDRTLLRERKGERTLLEAYVQAIEEAIRGGVTLVQLREKDLDSRTFYETANAVHAVTKKYGVPLLINDRIDIALAVGAEGVHLGQTDLPARIARDILGPDVIIGVTAKTVEQAIQAEKYGADYLGSGAMFSSQTKTEAVLITTDELREIANAVRIPIVAIGGIDVKNVHHLAGTGIDGVCVVSGILREEDIEKAASALAREVVRL